MANPIHFTLRSMLSFTLNEQADLGTQSGLEELEVGDQGWFSWQPGSSPADWVPDGTYDAVPRGDKKYTFIVEDDCKRITLKRTA